MRRALVGLIGANIGNSLSPAIHEDAFEAAGMRGYYHLMDLQLGSGRSLPALLEAARTAGFLGVNITFPCKEDVLPLLDAVSDEAAEIGAVNTVTIAEDGRTTGYNTDRSGFRQGFEDAFGRAAARGRTALLVGAGGAGRAVAFALFDLGLRVLLVHDQDRARANALATLINARYGPDCCQVAADLVAALAIADGVVNATPAGMLGVPGDPVPIDAIRPRHFVADVIYTPLETALVKAARAKGAMAAGGAGMCVYQAADAFRLFTGIAPDIARMHRAFMAAAGEREQALGGA
jgi:quinate/shikimate dehydrogenase (NAD+)